MQLSITAIPSFIDYVENQEIFRKSIKDYLEGKAMKLVEKTQNEFGGEPFMWSTLARHKFWLYEDFEKYYWIEKYPNAKVSVEFDVKIKDFGKHSAPPDRCQAPHKSLKSL